MLIAICPPDFATHSPAILRNHLGQREHWAEVYLTQPSQDADTGEALDARWRVWEGPYGHHLSDSSLKAIFMGGVKSVGSHAGMS